MIKNGKSMPSRLYYIIGNLVRRWLINVLLSDLGNSETPPNCKHESLCFCLGLCYNASVLVSLEEDWSEKLREAELYTL